MNLLHNYLLPLGTIQKNKKTEANFAALCGINPIPASSGKINQHRSDRDGDSAANRALHNIAIGRLRIDVKTKEYVKKGCHMGIQNLKPYIVLNALRNRNNIINSTQITA